MNDAKPLLGYVAPTLPSPLGISVSGSEAARGRVTVEVANRSGKERICDALTFKLALGEGSGDFTPANKVGDIKLRHSPGWAMEWDGNEAGSITASPNDQGSATVPAGNAPLFFEMDRIAVNTMEGEARLSIREELDEDGISRIGSDVMYCTKGPQGLSLLDFRPVKQVVASTEYAQVVWQFTPVANAKVELEYLDAGTGQQRVVDVTSSRNYEVRLYQDTSFALHAFTGAKQNPTFSYWLFTFVTVSEPYLTTRDLTVTGTLSFLGRRHTHMTQAVLTPPPATDTVRKTMDFLAETDGLLTGSLRTFFQHTNARLTLTVRPPDVSGTDQPEPHVAQAYCADEVDRRPYAPGPSLAVPVPKGSKVRAKWDLVKTAGFTGPEDTFLFATDLRWHPFGTGEIVLGAPLPALPPLISIRSRHSPVG